MKKLGIFLSVLIFIALVLTACGESEEAADGILKLTDAEYQATINAAVDRALDDPLAYYEERYGPGASSNIEILWDNAPEISNEQAPIPDDVVAPSDAAIEAQQPGPTAIPEMTFTAAEPAIVVDLSAAEAPVIGQTGFTLIDSSKSSYTGTVYYAVELSNPNEDFVLSNIQIEVTAYSADGTAFPAVDPVHDIQLYPQEALVVSGTISVSQPVVRVEAQVSPAVEYEIVPLSEVERPKYMIPIVSDLTFHDGCFISGDIMNPNDFDVTCNVWIALRDAAGTPVAGTVLTETVRGGRTRSFDVGVPIYGLGLRSPESLGIASMSASVELEAIG